MTIPRYGAPEVFEVRDVPERAPGPGEIAIAVRAAGVNFADVMARMGLYPDAPPLPLVAGYEVAGTVSAAGKDVTRFKAGDRVLALTRFGGYASSAITDASFAFATPASLTDVEAAAIPVNYLTAIVALYKMANVTAGETVLIHSAGGGVGIAAMQLAHRRGARVIGAASDGKHAALRSLGIDHVIDPRCADLVEEVRRLTNQRGVDVVLDAIGGRSFETSYRLLAPLGRLVMFGVSSVSRGERRNWLHAARTIFGMRAFKPLSLINRNRGVFGLNMAHLWSERHQLTAAMQTILDDVCAGHIRPVVANTFPLEQVAEAHRFMQARSNIGKVVLTVDGQR